MSLRVWLPLDGDLRNLGTSSYTINIFRGNNAYASTGILGKCFYAGGSNTLKIINILPDIYNYSAYTLCAWCRVDAQNTSHSGSAVISGGNWNGQLLNLAMSDWSSDHYTKLRISGTNWNRAYNYNFYKDIWYHIVVCDDGIHTYAYVNGVLIGDTAASFLPTSIEGNDICIGGATYYSGMQFFGKINDVRIYDHCLSAAEVREIAQGLILHYKLDGGVIGNLNLLPDSKVDGAWTYPSSSYADKYYVTTNTIPSGAQYTLSFDAKSTVNGDRIKTFYYNPNTTTTCISNQGTTKTAADGNMDFTLSTNWERYWVVYTQTNTTTAKNIICPRLVSGQGSGTVSVKNVKLEEGSIATMWRSAENTQTLIEDSSGYSHNGTIIGTPTMSSNTVRYSSAIEFPGTAYIKIPSPSIEAKTVSLWAKWNTIPSGQSVVYVDQKSKTGLGLASNGIIVNTNLTGHIFSKASIVANTWYHFVIVSPNGSSYATRQLYINGVEQTALSGTNSWSYTIDELQLGKRSTSSDGFNGKISDFRMYGTVLNSDDVLALYHMGAKIDNQANFHTYEINENNTNKITKTGIMYDNMIESIMTLPDGSHWQLLMFHYVDNGKNLFTSTNASNCNNFGLFSRLKDIDGFKIGNQYEFYAIQDGAAYRWIQTNAPLTTTSVTGFAAASGYTSPGAGICKCTGKTLLARTNSTSNWWNAFGCYTLYNGGIPGLNQVVCKKYLALYARIEKPDVKLSNQTANSVEFIEL